MRTLVAAAVACVTAIGLSRADDAQAVIRKSINIPAQELAPALQSFAQDRQLYIIYAQQDVITHRTAGATGDLTQDETLKRLLGGTGLTYQYLDDKTVTVLPIATAPASTPSRYSPSGDEARQEVSESKSWWQRLRLAQTNSPSTGDGRGAQGEGSVLSREGAVTELEEVIVTAQKRDERLQDVPISISVLSGDDLDRSTFTGALESLKTVPGVALLPNGGTGGGTLINIRGVGAASGTFNGSSPVGYYLDGVPFSLVRDAIAPDQNSFDLERIEVLRGPQGTLYGASSMNGLVRVLTKDADLNQFEFKARTTLSETQWADDLNYRGDAALNVPLIEGKLAVRAVVGYDNGSGWVDNEVENGINDTRTRNYRLKVNAQPTDALSIGLSAWVNRTDKDALSVSRDDKRTNTVLPEPATEDFDTVNLDLGYDFSTFSLVSSTSYLDYEATGTIDYTPFNAIIAPFFGTDVVFTSIPAESYSQEIILNSATGNAWKWTAGAFYRDVESGLLQTWPGVLVRPIGFTESSKSAAIFGQVGRRFGNNQWEWTLGVRYFDDEVDHQQHAESVAPGAAVYQRRQSYSATTPRAVLTWYPASNVTVYASYAQGFRSGLPLSSVLAATYPTFPDAKPDELNNYEIGAKLDVLDRRLSFDAAVYYIQWDDVQQVIAVPFQNTSATGLVNGESASGAGVDFSLTARPTQGLELGLNAGWNGLEIDDDVYTDPSRTQQLFEKGERLNVSPELTAGAYVRYNRPLGAGRYTGGLSVSANYVSEVHTRQAVVPRARVVAGDDLVFGKASFSVESPSGWSSSLFVDNFTNEYGQITGSLSPLSFERLARPRPRTIGVQFDYRFE